MSFSYGWPPVLAQEFTAAQELLIADLTESLAADLDMSELSERLRYYLKHPIRLNLTDEFELAALFFLSSLQISNILLHRQLSGPFLSVLELQSVQGMDKLSLERLYPFVTVQLPHALKQQKLGNIYLDSEQEIMMRYARVLERQVGYQGSDSIPAGYLGDPNRYWLWYRMRYKQHLRISFNAKKDAGEPFFRLKQRYGFDHYGLSIAVNDLGKIKHLIIGDYAMQIGQGLLLWNGLSFGKGALVGNSARQALGLKAYSSMNETDFLRGLALRLQFSNISLKPFFSFRRLSGNLQVSDTGARILHLARTGLHRTATEQAYRRAVKQSLFGLSVDYQRKRLKLGFAAVSTNFHARLTPPEQLRYRFSFRGSHLLNLGVNFNYSYRNLYMYAESAKLLAAGSATSTGLVASLDPKLSFFAHYRNYHKNYYAYYAQGFSEGANTFNEKAVYAGLVYHPIRSMELLSYLDMFRFPWLGYRVGAPSTGFDFFTQFSYRWYKLGKISLRYRYRHTEGNQELQGHHHVLEPIFKAQLRLDFQYRLSDTWEIRTRTEGIRFRKNIREDYGGMVYQDIFWRSRGKLRLLNLRFALFYTDSYDARLYAYEQDVLYGQSFRVLNNTGYRIYLNLRHRLAKKTDVWLRYAMTKYKNMESVGAGLDKSAGPKRSELKVQIRYQW